MGKYKFKRFNKTNIKNSTTVKEKNRKTIKKDEEIEVIVDQETIINGIEQNEDNIWGLLVGTGYLKVVEKSKDKLSKMCKVKIPNYEIKFFIYGYSNRLV